jgi:predicted  nucleic acid-binding Zn-ribbon protein
MIREALSNLGDVRSRMFRELRKNLNCELFDLQNEISTLKKENQELKIRIKELEVNWSYAVSELRKFNDDGK